MAVAFDATSESHGSTTGSASESSFTWNHTPTGTPAGVLVFTFVNANADNATGVTYGGVDMVAVPGGRAVDTAGEPGDCKAWFLGRGVLSGVQAVVVTRTNNANVMYAVAATVTALRDTEVVPSSVALEQENQALAEENINTGGRQALRFAAANSGLADITAALLPGANSTAMHGIDFGARVINTVRETTAGTGSRPVGLVGVSDDVAAVYLAVAEIPPPPFNNFLFVKGGDGMSFGERIR